MTAKLIAALRKIDDEARAEHQAATGQKVRFPFTLEGQAAKELARLMKAMEKGAR